MDGKIVYENNGFKILEYPTEKYVDDKTLGDEKIYHIMVTGENRPTFDDICETLFFLLKNKVYDGAFQIYKKQVLESVKRAEVTRKSVNTGLDGWM